MDDTAPSCRAHLRVVLLLVVGDLDAQSQHGNDKADQGPDEHPAKGAESDAIAVVESRTLRPQCRVPVPPIKCLKVSVFLELKHHSGDFFIKVTPLLHRHCIWLFREWLANLCEVAVVVELVLDLARVVDERKIALQLFF